MGSADTGGTRVAEVRKARGVTQAALARRAGISVSLLSKIEIGDRTLTPGIAAVIARSLQLSLGALYGEAEVSVDQSMLLEDLRTAVRRYDIPDQAPVPDPAQLRIDLDHAIAFREQADLAGLLRVLPGLLTRATTYAHAGVEPAGVGAAGRRIQRRLRVGCAESMDGSGGGRFDPPNLGRSSATQSAGDRSRCAGPRRHFPQLRGL